MLAAVLSADPAEMPPCSYCEHRQLECKISENDSSRCSSCIRANQPRCDFLGLTPEQLLKVSSQHRQLEAELEEAMEAEERAKARTRRIWKQKKMWSEKMMRAVARGIDNLAELEKLEAAEEWKRQAEQPSAAEPVVSGAGSPETNANLGIGVGEGSGWSLDGFNWDAIPTDPFGVVGEIFSEGAGHSSSA